MPVLRVPNEISPRSRREGLGSLWHKQRDPTPGSGELRASNRSSAVLMNSSRVTPLSRQFKIISHSLYDLRLRMRQWQAGVAHLILKRLLHVPSCRKSEPLPREMTTVSPEKDLVLPTPTRGRARMSGGGMLERYFEISRNSRN
jgi:hypothetical protein